MIKYTDDITEKIKNFGTEKSGMTDKEYNEKVRRFNYLRTISINPIIREYIYYLIRNVFISTDMVKQTQCRKMITDGDLNGWCWQSNTFLAPFMNPNSYVRRGILSFYPGDKYEHSWLEIHFMGKVYAFDPCFNFLCFKEDYENVLEVKIYSKIACTKFKEELINLFENNINDYIYIEGTNNFDDVFFRTDSKVYIKSKRDKIVLLRANILEDC